MSAVKSYFFTAPKMCILNPKGFPIRHEPQDTPTHMQMCTHTHKQTNTVKDLYPCRPHHSNNRWWTGSLREENRIEESLQLAGKQSRILRSSKCLMWKEVNTQSGTHTQMQSRICMHTETNTHTKVDPITCRCWEHVQHSACLNLNLDANMSAGKAHSSLGIIARSV